MRSNSYHRAIGTAATIAALAFTSGNSSAQSSKPVVDVTQRLRCDDTLKTRFQPDRQTTVLLVKQFKKGDPLSLSGTGDSHTPVAANDLCLVKLNVGPGNAGPADAPSTSPGIGIEVWLPSPANWNQRIHVAGGGGWSGGTEGSTTSLAAGGWSANIAAVEGAVSATTDTGHASNGISLNVPGIGNGSFGMNPDGTINTVLWHDFSERSIHEMAVKTKALTRAFYGTDARYAYWDGFSTGGRQALKEAQVNPQDFDGILAGAPAINWTRFITSELYPQIVMQRDLAGARISPKLLNLVSNAAIRSCDVVGGQHLGYIVDPASCRYDPTKDKSVLCATDGGSAPNGACVNRREARALNKIWYGQTSDGTAPSPASDNGFGAKLSRKQLWYGLTRGTDLTILAGPSIFVIPTDLVAMELGDPTISTPAFINAKGNGADLWKSLSYAQLKKAFDAGISQQDKFSHINTDNPDLSAFRARGGKLLMYHGLADFAIPPQGSINYYERVTARMGGTEAVQAFYRMYLIPGMSHGFFNGSANPDANPPLPTPDQLYRQLVAWVEKGIAPGRLDISSEKEPKRSWPLCVYPAVAKLKGSDPLSAGSYICSES